MKRKTYKVIRSSGWLQVENCGHIHTTKADADACCFQKNTTSEFKNWIVVETV